MLLPDIVTFGQRRTRVVIADKVNAIFEGSMQGSFEKYEKKPPHRNAAACMGINAV